MNFERTKNAKRNIVWSSIGKVLTLLVPFAMRSIVLYLLGDLYLGLSSLFTSVLQVLNLAELGVGSSLAFAMYKPAAEDDTEKLRVLLSLYKWTYLIIGAIVAVIGLALMPFLRNLISGETPEDINIYVLYAIYLSSTVASYWFFAYKGSILTVYQRGDISEKIGIVVNLITYGAQIATLYIFKNYYVYITIHLLSVIIKNGVVAIFVRRLYPSIYPEGKPSKELTKMVFKKAAAAMGHKVGGVVLNSIDNILISAFLGLTLVAQYNNYYYIFTSVCGVISILTTSLVPIVGNYLIKETKEKSYKLFNAMQYGLTFVISVCCCCFIALYQPFIAFWVGEENVLPVLLPFLLVLLFFVQEYRAILLLFKNAAGIWEQDLWKPWAQAIVNLLIDIWLLQTIGVYGAPISSIVATFFIAFFAESFVTHKCCFERSQHNFLLQTLLYMTVVAASCACVYFVCGLFSFDSAILNIFLYLVIAVCVGSFLFLSTTFWTSGFKSILIFIKSRKKKTLKNKKGSVDVSKALKDNSELS